MIIKNLNIQRFRNISQACIEAAPHFNAFYGQNGSGKTSILEAVYYLGLSKSFRSSNPCRVIQDHSESCSIVAQLQNEHRQMPLGIERNRQGRRILRKDSTSVSSIFALAQELPLQLITADSHTLFTEGPKRRRQFFDWGLFHVEPHFYALWQQLQKVLKQRNSALKARLPAAEIKLWDSEFVKLAHLMHQLRQNHLKSLQSTAYTLFAHLLPEAVLEMGYYPGWDETEGLQNALHRHFQQDLQLGYTQMGPHRADLHFWIKGDPIQDYLSQGQLKLAAYALHLAQGQLLQTLAHKSPIYLIDDMPSELDLNKRHLIIELLSQLSAQAWITGIYERDLLDISQLPGSSLFHVKHGAIASLQPTPLL